MSHRDLAAVERHLTAGVQPTGDRFIGDELSGLPEAAYTRSGGAAITSDALSVRGIR